MDRTIFDRVLDVVDGIDILYVIVILVCATGWGAWVVGGWIVDAWRIGAWWSFGLMTATSAFLLGGLTWELKRRRAGAFALVIVGAALLLGVGRLFA